MLRWIGKNISTFFLALILAIGVWAAAVNASDPNEELTYPKPIPIEIVGQDTNLLITNAYSEQIALTLRAPHSIWKQLIASEDNIHAILDLSGLGAGEYTLEPQIQIGTQPTRIVSFVPSTVHITLEELTTRTLPIDVHISGEPSIGYRAGTPVWIPEEVTVSGAKSLVDKVKTARVFFNLSNAREDIDEMLSLEILDEQEQPIHGVNLSPEKIQLRIPVSQQGGYRDVAVKVGVTGQVANLYRLTNISVFPPVITVYSADTQLINELPGVVETEPLDIEGISEDISARLKLILPENVSIVGDQSVLVQVSVEAILGSMTISEKPLEIINLAPALYAELSPQNIDVIVSGPLPALDTLNPEDLRVIVDLANLTPGEYQLAPIVEILNEKIKVESILPESIKVTISDTPPATSTPPTP
jgi:YbbR domain-containing protein